MNGDGLLGASNLVTSINSLNHISDVTLQNMESVRTKDKKVMYSFQKKPGIKDIDPNFIVHQVILLIFSNLKFLQILMFRFMSKLLFEWTLCLNPEHFLTDLPCLQMMSTLPRLKAISNSLYSMANTY